MASLRHLKAYVAHLRLGFQPTLMPIFLWGALLSGGRWDARTGAAFLSLHLFLYPAATAFNSAFDRDEGPVGGMERPPEVPPGLLGFSALVAAAGAVAAAQAGLLFLVLYGLVAAWAAAYSHPAIRWKASPAKSGAAIALGQGGLGFLAGWAAVAPPGPVSEALVAGALVAALTALGLYPATQVFQVEEDAARGDRTLAVALGPARALRLGALCLLLGGAVAAWLAARRFGPSDAVLVALGYAALIAGQERLARTLGRGAVYRRAMRLLYWASAGFLLFLGLEAAGSS